MKVGAVLVLAAALTCACISTTHKMLPDGTWMVDVDAPQHTSGEKIEGAFEERAHILCPQGYSLISKSNIEHGSVGPSPGLLARFTCKGEKAMTSP